MIRSSLASKLLLLSLIPTTTVVLAGIGIERSFRSSESAERQVLTASSALELANDVSHQGKVLGQVTVSIGIAAYPEHGADRDVLVRMADEALYRTKNAGRDRAIVAALPARGAVGRILECRDLTRGVLRVRLGGMARGLCVLAASKAWHSCHVAPLAQQLSHGVHAASPNAELGVDFGQIPP